MLSDYHSLHELFIIQHVYFGDNNRRPFAFLELSWIELRNCRKTNSNSFFNFHDIFAVNRNVHRLLRTKTEYSSSFYIFNVRGIRAASVHVPFFPYGPDRNFPDYIQHCSLGQQLFFGAPKQFGNGFGNHDCALECRGDGRTSSHHCCQKSFQPQ